MDKELIKITENNGRRAVDARELHGILGSKRDFSHWIKDRINKYGFIENQDYEVYDNFGENPQGGRPMKDYTLSIDMAKELAMVENNEQGRKIRQYFIMVEKEYKQSLSPARMLLESAKMLVEVEEKMKQQDLRLQVTEQRLNKLDDEREQATRNLLITPYLSKKESPDYSLRDVIRKLVNDYSSATNIEQHEVWHKIYADLYYVYHKNIKAYKKQASDKSKLDIAERNNLLDYIHSIISRMINALKQK